MIGLSIVLNGAPHSPKLSDVVPAGLVSTKRRFMTSNSLEISLLTNDKFIADKVLSQDEDLVLAIDGVILNLSDLMKRYGTQHPFETLKALYLDRGEQFMSEMVGSFSGILQDKKRGVTLIFTDQVGSKPLFIFKCNGGLIASGNMVHLTTILRAKGYSTTLDVMAAYSTLTLGFMLEEQTLVSEISRIKPGQYIRFSAGKCHWNYYFRLEIQETKQTVKSQIFSELDEKFANAIQLEYAKDAESSYRHLATLSGGLDSRMNVVMGHELGFKNIMDVTFGHSESHDLRIAKKIALDLGHEHVFVSLGNGDYLHRYFEDVTLINGCMGMYPGAAQGMHAWGSLNLKPFGIIHTGQLGDAVFGSYLETIEKNPSNEAAECLFGSSNLFLNKIKSYVKGCLASYDSLELFMLYNRGFNRILMGNWMAYRYTEVISPFLNPDFLKYVYSLPASMRSGEQLYIQWIQDRHKLVGEYIWEKTGAKPGENKLKRFLRRIRGKIVYRLDDYCRVGSMNPYVFWYNNNETLRKFFEQYFFKKIELLDEKELKKDARALFKNGNFTEKTQVISLLRAVDMYIKN